MYLILIHYFNADSRDETWFSDKAFRQRHGMAEATRLNGLNQLVNRGVVTMRERFPDVQHGAGYRATKRRYYTLDPVFEPSVMPKAVAAEPAEGANRFNDRTPQSAFSRVAELGFSPNSPF